MKLPLPSTTCMTDCSCHPSLTYLLSVHLFPLTHVIHTALPDKVALGQEATMTAVFKNTLPVKMSDVTLTIECDELLSGMQVDSINTDILNKLIPLTCILCKFVQSIVYLLKNKEVF